MDDKSKTLILILLITLGASVWLTYDRTVIRKDFEIEYSESESEEVGENVLETLEYSETNDIGSMQGLEDNLETE